MAVNKEAAINLRVQKSLRDSFDEAFAKQSQFSSMTSFIEGCMSAMILAVRQKRELAIPLEFLEKENLKGK
jgi:hypothetical protein